MKILQNIKLQKCKKNKKKLANSAKLRKITNQDSQMTFKI